MSNSFTAESSLFKTPTRNRPKANDAEVLASAALALAKAVLRDYKDDFPDDTPEDLVDDLTQALQAGDDGYEIAQVLDHIGWEIDAEKVELFNGRWRSDAHRDAVKRWVIEQQVLPALSVGARVDCNKLRGGLLRDMVVGTVTKVYLEIAEYAVHEDGDENPDRAWLVPYENVTALT